MTNLGHPADRTLSIEPGLVHLRRPARDSTRGRGSSRTSRRGPRAGRSRGLCGLVAAGLAAREGTALWIDAGGDAATHALSGALPRGRGLADVRVARAFTAYQHHALVRRAVRRADARTALVVAPCTAALYRDDDVPDYLGRDLLDASLSVLRELARAREVPVVVTTPGEDRAGEALVAERADRTVECHRTRAGLRYVGPDAETTVYRDAGGWQTTVPYWVALCGCVCDREPTAPSPLAAAEG